jgi:hypothetical protein
MAFARDARCGGQSQGGSRRLRVLASVLGVAIVALLAMVVLAFHYANVANGREAMAQRKQENRHRCLRASVMFCGCVDAPRSMA